jgi:hypothetical protein
LNTNVKKTTAITFIILATTLLLATFANAQTTTDQAIVVILPSTGGTTTPAEGTYPYDNGTTITLSATPSEGFEFKYWVISGEYTPGHTTGTGIVVTDPDTGEVIQLPRPPAATGADSLVVTANQLGITCGYGYTFTYQAVFGPTNAPPTTTPPPQTQPPTSNDQVIKIVPSVGGTTSPAPGTYTYTSGQTATLSATPNSGFQFHYWIVTGSYAPGHEAQPQWIPDVTEQVPSVPQSIYLQTQDSLVFSTNPVTITCGYGYTYQYQAVFTPAGDTHANVIPTATPPPTAAPATPTPAANTPTPAPTATPAAADYTWAIIAAVVVIIIIIVVVAAVMMRKKK